MNLQHLIFDLLHDSASCRKSNETIPIAINVTRLYASFVLQQAYFIFAALSVDVTNFEMN